MIPNQQEIEAKVKEIICRELKLEPAKVTSTTKLRELAGVESIKILRIVTFVESHYDVEMEDQIIFKIETIQDTATAVRNLLEKRAGTQESG
jgi:acyl carrier protein